MSDIFALDSPGQDRVAEMARANPFDPADASPSFFSNLPAAVGDGLMRGGARAVQAGGIIAGGVAQQINRIAGGEPDAVDPWFKAVDDVGTNAVDYWTPDAQSTGAAGRVLGGFGEIALPLMVGAGNPSLLLASQEVGTAADLTRKGVDAPTAIAAGTAQGAATALGFKVPFLGSTLATRMASGAAGNLAVNAGTTAATGELLRQRGYEDLAKGYDAADFEARMIDLITGMAFGGLHHGLSPDAPAVNPRVSDAVVDAAMTARNARNFQETTAPGVVPDVGSSIAHQDAIGAALEQLSRNEPVNVGEVVATHEGASFGDRGDAQRIKAVARETAGDKTESLDDVTLELGEETVAIRSLPSSENLAIPDAPSIETLNERSRVQDVPLEKTRRTQNTMGGESPGPMFGDKYADMPVAVRLENGEFLVFDGHHRTVAALEHGRSSLPMHVIDAKTYAPELAGRKPSPERMSDDELLAELGVDTPPVEKPTTPEPQPEGEPIAPSAAAEAATPELQGLRDLAAQQPDAIVHTGYDEEGNPVTSTVAAEAKRIEEEHAQAVNDSKAYEAAVQCFMGNGA